MPLSFFKALEFYLLPGCCVLCGSLTRRNSDMCHNCAQDLPYLKQGCYQCGLPIPSYSSTRLYCGQCQLHSPAYDCCAALFTYSYPINHLITQFKYYQHFSYGRVLSELLATHLCQHYQASTLPQAIIPMPLHRQRLQERGFNQSVFIAKHLQDFLNVPILYNHLLRHRYTVPQVQLSDKERHHNVKNAFGVCNTLPSRIALIDDVMTTGATAAAACQILKQNGAQEVHLWCVARTIPI